MPGTAKAQSPHTEAAKPILNHLGSLITVTHPDGTQNAMGFLVVHPQHGVFDASIGKVDVSPQDADTHNKLLSQALIDAMATAKVGEGGTFYVQPKPDARDQFTVTTWLGGFVAIAYLSSPKSKTKLKFTRNGQVWKSKKRFRHETAAYFERIS